MTAKQVLERCEQLAALRSPHEYLWREIGNLKNAKYLEDGKGQATKGFIPHADIHDTTLRRAGRMQANGITSMLFPRDKDWLRIVPPWQMRKERAAQKLYREAGEAVLHYLRQSNFHHQNHGVILSRSGDGTGCMQMEWIDDDDGTEIMNFRRFQTMRYMIDQNTKGIVDTFSCEYHWSAAQAATEWGLDNLSSKLQGEVKDTAKRNKTHAFTVLIEKRPVWERKEATGNKAMPYRFVVVENQTKHMVVDSGLEVFNIIASRYETYDSPWGYSPAWEVLPDAYKANYAAKFMMVMGERAAVPPVIAPASMKEEGIGLGAAEVTYVSDVNPNLWPKELAGGGNYQIGMEVWKKLQDAIDEAYHGNLFNMFSRQTRQITAYEANQMAGELNAQVDPTITALNQDHTDPVISWVFNSLAERGIIELPEQAYDSKTGKPITPQFAYHNAITMNHKEGKALKALEIMQFFGNLAASGADVDVAKLDEVSRRIWRDLGQDEDELLSETEYQERQDEKEAAMKAAQELEMAKQGAGAAKDAAAAGLDVSGMLGQAGGAL